MFNKVLASLCVLFLFCACDSVTGGAECTVGNGGADVKGMLVESTSSSTSSTSSAVTSTSGGSTPSNSPYGNDRPYYCAIRPTGTWGTIDCYPNPTSDSGCNFYVPTAIFMNCLPLYSMELAGEPLNSGASYELVVCKGYIAAVGQGTVPCETSNDCVQSTDAVTGSTVICALDPSLETDGGVEAGTVCMHNNPVTGTCP